MGLYRNDYKEIANMAAGIRILSLQAISTLGQGHVGGSLSVADVLAVLYEKIMDVDWTKPGWKNRDHLIVSKGHAGPAVYAALALKGYFPHQELTTLNQPKTNLPSHCDRLKTKGVDMTTGSLGQGVSAAVGIALGCRMQELKGFTYLIMGDGEANEGQVWEAAQFASKQKLGRLIGFLDWNKLQLDGTLEEVSGVANFEEKFMAFGWQTIVIDGHDFHQIYDAIILGQQTPEQPTMIIMQTTKGKGFARAEQAAANNHSMAVSSRDYSDAVREIEKWLAEQQSY